MDETHYKLFKTQRGFTYNYYYRSQSGTKQSILFLHGFPSTSHDWVAQAAYFSHKGYGLIIPDLLGYGGTDKPVNAEDYRYSAMAQDVIDILDHESIDKVLLVGHDWGSTLASRIVNNFVERLLGVAFLALGYSPPQPDYNYEKQLESMDKLLGYDLFGYWEYFASSDGPKQCEENIDSFYSLVFPRDPTIWKLNMAPRGKIREWIENNKQGPLPAYWNEQEKKKHQQELLRGGLVGPCNWYAAKMRGLNNADDAAIPRERWSFSIPCFYGSALKDYICLPDVMRSITQRFGSATSLIREDFNTSHWVMFEAPAELNTALENFFNGIVSV